MQCDRYNKNKNKSRKSFGKPKSKQSLKEQGYKKLYEMIKQ